MRRGIAAAMAGRLQDLALVGSRLRVRYMLYPAQVVPQPIGRVKRLSTTALNSHPQAAMARKNRRSQVRKPQRGSSGSARATRPAGLPPAAPSSDAATPAPSPAAQAPPPSRLVQRPLPRARGRQPSGPLAAEDAAIPLDRVPYFRSDLRRIALTAGFMFLLLIAGSVLLRGLLQA